jgi:hypothetical protein
MTEADILSTFQDNFLIPTDLVEYCHHKSAILSEMTNLSSYPSPPIVLKHSTWDLTLSRLVFSNLHDIFSNYSYLKNTVLPHQTHVPDSPNCSIITKLFPINQFSTPAPVPVKKTAKNFPPHHEPPKCT